MVFEKVYVNQKQAEKPNTQTPQKETTKINHPKPNNCEVISLDTAGNMMNCGKQTHLKLSEAEHIFRIFPLLI